MAKVMDDVLVAYGQNGEPIRPDHGFPLRLLVPGFEGIYNVKWLKTIKVVDQPYKTFQERSPVHGCRPAVAALHLRARAEVGHHVPVRRRPSAGARNLHDYRFGLVRRGAPSVGWRSLPTVGKTWTDAKLRGPALKRAFARFDLVWKWKGEEAVLQSRCTDELDQVQPSVAEFARFWNETESEIFSGRGQPFWSCQHHPIMEGGHQWLGAERPGDLVFSLHC